MFRNLPVFGHDPALLDQVADTMTVDIDDATDASTWAAGGVNQSSIPSGFTYFGQFIDHDITFDPVSSLERQNDPDALENFRTPKFDLDSLYGRGPADQPYLYVQGSAPLPIPGSDADARGVLLALGDPVPVDDSLSGHDLPRFGDRALIGDPRNDENLIVSQLHVAFIKYHNATAATVANSTELRGPDLLKEVQRRVRWTYQWIVVHDFLPRVVDQAVIDDVLQRRPVTYGTENAVDLATWIPRFYRPQHHAYMPVEFSAAAYRFGHSMVRPSYSFNDFVEGQVGGPTALFSDDPNPLANLNGFRRLPAQWAFDWRHFFELDSSKAPQPALRIDSRLAVPLAALPGTSGIRSLAALNLRRGQQLGLPAGQHVARAMGLTPLTDDELGLTQIDASFAANSPLWFYILKEAELTAGDRLGAVGGRVVAETLIGLLASDRLSYLRVEPNWTPTETSMAALLNAAQPTQ